MHRCENGVCERARAAMTDSAGAESSQRGDYRSAGTIVPSGRHSPSPGGTGSLGALLPAPAPASGALPCSPEHSGRLEAARVGGTRQKAAEIALPARSSPPTSSKGTRSRDSLSNSGGSEREQVGGPGSALGVKGGPDPAPRSAGPAATPPPP